MQKRLLTNAEAASLMHAMRRVRENRAFLRVQPAAGRVQDVRFAPRARFSVRIPCEREKIGAGGIHGRAHRIRRVCIFALQLAQTQTHFANLASARLRLVSLLVAV